MLKSIHAARTALNDRGGLLVSQLVPEVLEYIKAQHRLIRALEKRLEELEGK